MPLRTPLLNTARLGFGTFDVNDPTAPPSGAFYTPGLPDPTIEPDSIDLFPPDVREAWNAC